MLFVLATVAIIATRFWDTEVAEIRGICTLTFMLTAAGAVLLGVLITPGFTDGRGTRALARLPRVGHSIEQLIEAVRMYRRKPHVLLGAALMSIAVHSCFATGIFLIASGLPGDVLSLGTHFVIAPLSATTGAVPLPMGPFELVLEFLYTNIDQPGATITAGQGLIVALGYRLICVLTAAVGIGYYFSSRRELAEVMRQAERNGG